jgi:hypothetical protein
MSINPAFLNYPPLPAEENKELGVFPVDFLLETILRAGLEWFRTTPGAATEVFGHLRTPYLSGKYGEAKITEISEYIKKYEIRIVQHFALIDQTVPSISIQLLDGSEMTERAGLADFQGQIDVLDAEDMVKGRTEIGYAPVMDNIQIGIHAIGTPDLTKYLYYLVIYILCSFKPELEARGLQLGTFRATDMSRLNEYLPENLYSRFINFSVFTIAKFSNGIVPIVEKILGVHVDPQTGHSDEDCEEPRENPELGIGLCDIQQEVGD